MRQHGLIRPSLSRTLRGIIGPIGHVDINRLPESQGKTLEAVRQNLPDNRGRAELAATKRADADVTDDFS